MKTQGLLVAAMLFAGCSSMQGTSAVHGLQSGPDARHAGVYSFDVRADSVTLYDEHGVELGLVRVVSAGADRNFVLDRVDGTTDQVEVYKPMADGSFLAPITPETALTATLADPALASLWAAHDVRFTLDLTRRLSAEAGLAPEATASTSSCSSYSCSGSGCTPAGCAKPANTSAGCVNSGVFPATTYAPTLYFTGTVYNSLATCNSHATADCVASFGGTSGDWPAAAISCTRDGDGLYDVRCKVASKNRWDALCPVVSCPGYSYDMVPRLGSCVNPGSCTYSTGTVWCN